jgi:hypothetical protein
VQILFRWDSFEFLKESIESLCSRLQLCVRACVRNAGVTLNGSLWAVKWCKNCSGVAFHYCIVYGYCCCVVVVFISVLEFIVLEQWIMLLLVNSIELHSRMWVSSLPITLTDRPVSLKAALQRSRNFCTPQLEHKAATLAFMTPHVACAINV